ncbi:DNA-binding response regulator, LuxR family [Devosia sp. LC5]|uniref:response regulator n=1 Tax=Devosia sp. LC5 TaxID=1502724 RepID=UPI0004E44D75|nr:response regulator transcription factor [Devosia sp. LC5]KFC61792.1 DNA-binding response regulator, LuxR family [Devosia sp. LC5]
MSEKPIKVLLVDNHPLVLDGLKAILETFERIHVVGVAGLALAGLEIARTMRPQVALMDINMPHVNGIEALELFREQVPETRVLMLSMHDSREYISTSVMHGASGYVLKDVSTEEIVEAIEMVAAGGTYFSSGVADVLLERRSGGEAVQPLTAREYSVLLLIAGGQSNKQVAEALSISAATVETHRKKIKKKLGVSSTAGLTRYAIENGLV